MGDPIKPALDIVNAMNLSADRQLSYRFLRSFPHGWMKRLNRSMTLPALLLTGWKDLLARQADTFRSKHFTRSCSCYGPLRPSAVFMWCNTKSSGFSRDHHKPPKSASEGKWTQNEKIQTMNKRLGGGWFSWATFLTFLFVSLKCLGVIHSCELLTDGSLWQSLPHPCLSPSLPLSFSLSFSLQLCVPWRAWMEEYAARGNTACARRASPGGSASFPSTRHSKPRQREATSSPSTPYLWSQTASN